MTATIRPPSSRRPVRLGSMEILGFFETPEVATTWRGATKVAAPLPEPVVSRKDPLADWIPTDITGSPLLRGNVRWRVVLVTLLAAAGVVGAAIWFYEMPQVRAEEALADVRAGADALRTDLLALRQLNTTLVEPGQDLSATTAQLLSLDDKARALFDSSAELSSLTARSLAADAAGDALDASRLLRGAVSFRAAVVPILAAPHFETDPSLITLEEAARKFSDWRIGFEELRAELPRGDLGVVASELDSISVELDFVQGRYLDALRSDDTLAAVLVIDDLVRKLGSVEQTLNGALLEIQARVDARIDDALEAIGLLVG